MGVNEQIIQGCSELLGKKVESIHQVSGGDISDAYQIRTAQKSYFAKYNAVPFAHEMFEAEKTGLKLLGSCATIRTPAVIGVAGLEGGCLLLMEFIESGIKTKNFWMQFGRSLAMLHRQTRPMFGSDNGNFIGSLPQQNNPHAMWSAFYISERLQPQLDMALQSRRLQKQHQLSFEKLYKKLDDLCPAEPPALTHGDLWSGNFLVDENGQPVLIDPAVAYAHREMDIAMSRLFGGFDQQFYQSYHEAYPLAPGFESRLEIYQLYYLLVHVNLFGGSYVQQVERAVGKFV